MSKIEAPRFSEQLGRLLNIKANEGPQDLAPEMNAVFVLENDRPEWGIHKRERWCQRAAVQAAGAGFASKVKFRNPVGSGVIAVFDRLWVNTDLASTLLIRVVLSSVDYATATARAIAMDTRYYEGVQVAALSSIISSRQATDVADADSGYFRMTWPTGPREVSAGSRAPIAILAPGYAMEVQSEAAFVGMQVSATWRERSMTLAELRP